MNNSRWLRPFLVVVAVLIFVASLMISNLLVGSLEVHVKDLEVHVKDMETHVKDFESHLKGMEAHVKDMETHVKGLEGVVEERRQEELNKMKLWVEAMTSIYKADTNTDLNLAISVLESNNTIPMVVIDKKGKVNNYRNIVLAEGCDTMALVNGVVERAKEKGYLIKMDMGMSVYYDESLVLSRLSGILEAQSVLLDSQSQLLSSQSKLLERQSQLLGRQSQLLDSQSQLLEGLSYYPYVQLTVLLLFFVICILAVLSSKRAEQNRVWVGLSKETAHQLGTPISSLMAWTEVLKEKYPDDELIPEMERDVARLQRVAERFSKIGSMPEPVPVDIVDVVEGAVGYVKRRSPAQVEYEVVLPERPLMVPMNAPLVEWVLENLCKNAVDAMNGNGKITVTVSHDEKSVYVDVADTGKGIAKSCQKRVFEPGYTTKKRGWGLGLSLAKRIIEQYHKGRIFVKNSVQGKGTTFRVELKK